MADIRSIVESNFEVVRDRSSGNELVFICPEPECGDRTGNRSVNLKTGLTNCWKCNKGGPLVHWAKNLGLDVDVESPNVGIDELGEMSNFLSNNPKLVPLRRQKARLPRGFVPITPDLKGGYARLIESMAIRKNLELKDFLEAGVGFTRDNPRWEPYAIFPVIEADTTVYWQGRTYIDKPGESTKLFPSKMECPLGSKHWVYDIDRIPSIKPCILIIVESILNVLSLKKALKKHGVDHIIPVAVFKHSVSDIQISKLIRYESIKEICIMFDADATRSSWKLSSQIGNIKKMSVAEIPAVLGKKQDANDDAEVALESFVDRSEWSLVQDHVLSVSHL